jgi:MoxR-like ATPase
MTALNSTVALDVPELIQAILWDLEAGHPVSIVGRTGIGKSEICYYLSERLGLKMIERRLSQMTEGDMIGLPSTKDGVTRYNPPDFYKQACEEACLLFFDERDRAVHEVSQAIMQIVDSRTLNGFKLHEGTRIISAINGGSHATSHNYNTNAGDAAENDRWVSYEFDPSVEAWLKHAINKGVSDEIVKFISDNPGNLEFVGTMEPGRVYPSRRSWFRLDSKLKKNDLIRSFRDKAFGANTMIANCA